MKSDVAGSGAHFNSSSVILGKHTFDYAKAKNFACLSLFLSNSFLRLRFLLILEPERLGLMYLILEYCNH